MFSLVDATKLNSMLHFKNLSRAILLLSLFMFIIVTRDQMMSAPLAMSGLKFPEPEPRTHLMGPPIVIYVRVPKTGSKTLRDMFEINGASNKVLWRKPDDNNEVMIMTVSDQASDTCIQRCPLITDNA